MPSEFDNLRKVANSVSENVEIYEYDEFIKMATRLYRLLSFYDGSNRLILMFSSNEDINHFHDIFKHIVSEKRGIGNSKLVTFKSRNNSIKQNYFEVRHNLISSRSVKVYLVEDTDSLRVLRADKVYIMKKNLDNDE